MDYSITDPSDPLYNEDSAHPVIEASFERMLTRNTGPGLLWSEETAALARRHRRERQELAVRQHRERQDARPT